MARPLLHPNDHVDIVHNQWTAGTQSVEARVSVHAGRLLFRGLLASQWRHRLVDGFAESGLPDPIEEPERFVVQLHERYQNDYFFATEPHDRDLCPYGSKRVIQMPTAPQRGSPAVAR